MIFLPIFICSPHTVRKLNSEKTATKNSNTLTYTHTQFKHPENSIIIKIQYLQFYLLSLHLNRRIQRCSNKFAIQNNNRTGITHSQITHSNIPTTTHTQKISIYDSVAHESRVRNSEERKNTAATTTSTSKLN